MEYTGTPPLAEIKTVAELVASHLWDWQLWFLMGLKSVSCTHVISVSDFRIDIVNGRGFSQNLHPLVLSSIPYPDPSCVLPQFGCSKKLCNPGARDVTGHTFFQF